MANRTATLVAVLQDAVSDPARKIKRELNGIGSASHGLKGALGAAGGAMVDLAKVGAVAATAGVVALAGGLAYATKQAAAEEIGIARLDQALRNNVKGFDGNTAAIERTIKERQALAFSDDELRKSLSDLVARTKDTTKAFDLQSIAMDLARAKGVDLQTATGIIGKVFSGNVGILSRYGIAVRKGATATEALAAIQKMAAGQAEAYGETTQGAFEAFRIAVDDVVEDIGGALLPVATAFARFVSADLVPAIGEIAGRFSAWVEANRPVIDQLTQFVAVTLRQLVATVMSRVIPAFVAMLERFASFARTVASEVAPTLVSISGKLAALATVITTQVAPLVLDLATRVWENGLNRVLGAAIELFGDVAAELTSLVRTITGSEGTVDGLRAGADAVGTAFGFLADNLDKVVAILAGAWAGQMARSIATLAVQTAATVAAAGGWAAYTAAAIAAAAATAAAALPFVALGVVVAGAVALIVMNWDKVVEALRTGVRIIGDAFAAVGAVVGRIVDAIRTFVGLVGDALAAIGRLTNIRLPTISLPTIGASIDGERAAGGPVRANKTYLVGERGPELLSLGSLSGYVTPTEKLVRDEERLAPSPERTASPGGKPVQINLVVDGRRLAEIVDERLYLKYRSAAKGAPA